MSFFSRVCNETGLEVFEQMGIRDAAENVFISPLSVGAALSVVLFGARGETRTQIGRIESSLTYEKIKEWTNPSNMRYWEVNMRLPRFKTEETYHLEKVLQSMGMTDAFNRKANFSGMLEGINLRLSTVIQRPFIEVNEEGGEAAAATGRTVFEASAEIPVNIFANQPIIFMIKEKQSECILFLGRYSSP